MATFRAVQPDDGGGGTQGPRGDDLDSRGESEPRESGPVTTTGLDPSMPILVDAGGAPGVDFPAFDPASGGGSGSPENAPTQAASEDSQNAGIVADASALVENVVILVLVVVGLQLFDVIDL